MKKYNIFNYLCKYQEMDNKLGESLSYEDNASSLLTEDDLRILRDPDSDESVKILAMIRARIN